MTFKSFSPRTQAILKMETSQLFGRAELNEVDGHNSTRSSLTYSTTSSWSDVNPNQAAENDTGNTIQALNYFNVYTDDYTREVDNDTRDSIQELDYSNIYTHPKSTNSLVLGSYPVLVLSRLKICMKTYQCFLIHSRKTTTKNY